jgi:4-hydroxybenzoate polyprenyltransferase
MDEDTDRKHAEVQTPGGASGGVARLLLLRGLVPLVLGALFALAVLPITGFEVGRSVPPRNVLLPIFILFVVWNAGVTIAGALTDRRNRRARGLDDGV